MEKEQLSTLGLRIKATDHVDEKLLGSYRR